MLYTFNRYSPEVQINYEHVRLPAWEDKVYDGPKDRDSVTTMADIQWFYAKSKVPICLAITDSYHFLEKLKETDFLSEEEALELQGDTRTVPRVVYECLCCIEEKEIGAQDFFTFLFQKSFLKRYPDLNPIYAEYQEGKYRYGIHSTADMDKDPLIFAQEKVRICLTITDRFPFLHGLQDLTILSESEALKLHADERPVSRVIYESLSLIEKKDLKLNIVFEYIFQQCYLKLYPGLQDILQEPSGDFAPFNGGQCPKFNIATDVLEFFEHNKTYISEAVNERFPFLNGLQDLGLLSHIHMLKLQADRRSTKEVLYEALSHIQTISDIETFFAYVFQEFYLKLYPGLQICLQCLNAALTLDICPPPGKIAEAQGSSTPIAVIVKDEMETPQNSGTPSTVLYEEETRDILDEDSSEPSTVTVKDEIIEISEQDSSDSSPVSYEDETKYDPEQNSDGPFSVMPKDENLETPDQDYSEPSPVLYEDENNELMDSRIWDSSDVTFPHPVRKCRMHPINYSEPPDLDVEANNGEKIKKEPENPKRHKTGTRKLHEISMKRMKKMKLSRKNWESVQGIQPMTVKVEFPKQVFDDKFKVRCGDKTGIFKKELWTGNSSKDLCIASGHKAFSVTKFEKYGGRGASKNWKKTIQCWNPETSRLVQKKEQINDPEGTVKR
ncbi:uncharacterized protein [Engystomops pustulosus]|uniref:uncharacterized protein isoform X2 n=1 Tax=Engystomops pustulosus TaxID=76066 RepID=UPI003AFB3CD4